MRNHRPFSVLASLAVALSSAAAQPGDALRDAIEARSRAFFTSSRTPGLAVVFANSGANAAELALSLLELAPGAGR